MNNYVYYVIFLRDMEHDRQINIFLSMLFKIYINVFIKLTFYY